MLFTVSYHLFPSDCCSISFCILIVLCCLCSRWMQWWGMFMFCNLLHWNCYFHKILQFSVTVMWAGKVTVKASTLCTKSVNSNFWCCIVNRVAILIAFTVQSDKPTFISPKLASLPTSYSVCLFLLLLWLVGSQLGTLLQYDKRADGIRL
jgi:hypothetical protein